MNIKRFMQFMEGDKDAGGGGGVPDVADILGEPDTSDTLSSGDGDDTVPADGGSEPDKGKGSPVLVDLDALSEKFGAQLGKHFAKVPDQNDPKLPELTPEEAKKMLQLFEPDENFLKEFGNLETQGKALVKFRDGILRTAYIMAEMQRQQMEKVMEGRFTPIQSMLETRQREELVQRFDQTYPQLADPELRPLLDSVATTLGKAGKLTNDPAANFKLIAEGAARVIMKTAPTFKLEPKGSATTKPATTPKGGGITVTTPGGGGGGGGSRGGESGSGLPKLVGLLGKVGGG